MDNFNFPIVTIKQFTEIIKGQIASGNMRPIIGIGKGGIGKSESIETLATQELGIGYIDIRLLLYRESDLKGIPYPDKDHESTIWLQNSILPRAGRNKETGILVFDEITSCQKSLRTAAYQLLQERRLGEYVLPRGWLVVCLGNGPEDGGDFSGLEANFLNRCSVFNLQSNFEDWKEWGMSNGIHPSVLAYLSWQTQDFHTFNNEEEYQLFASPRSWTAVSDILNENGCNVNSYVTSLRVAGNIGVEIANKFIAFCKLKVDAIEPELILSGKCNKNISDKGVLILTVQNLINKYIEEAKMELSNNKKLSNDCIVRGANAIKWLLSLQGSGMLEVKTMALKDFGKASSNVMRILLFDDTFCSLCPELNTYLSQNKGIFK